MKIKNNPLNIKYKSCNNFQGQLKPLKGFCRFRSIEHGFRAGVVLFMRLKAFDKHTYKHFVLALYENNLKSQDYITNLVNMANDSYALNVKENADSFIPLEFLPSVLIRLSSLEQGFFDPFWEKSVINVLDTYLYKCGLINDINSMMYFICNDKH